MNIDELEDYLDWRRETVAKTAARSTRDGKPVSMARMTKKPLDRQAQAHVEGSERHDLPNRPHQ